MSSICDARAVSSIPRLSRSSSTRSRSPTLHFNRWYPPSQRAGTDETLAYFRIPRCDPPRSAPLRIARTGHIQQAEEAYPPGIGARHREDVRGAEDICQSPASLHRDEGGQGNRREGSGKDLGRKG